MSSNGKVRVLVKSRKVPTGVIQLRQTTYLLSGIPGIPMKTTRTEHRVLYDYVLDEDHQRAIEEARKLAGSLCLDLEVIDSRNWSFLGRLLSFLDGRGGGNPSIVVTPPAMATASDSPPISPPTDSARP
jgi:hypothetical protein